MAAVDEATQELNTMLDDGVNVELSERVPREFLVRVVLDDASCADCLVPDTTLSMIATDALERRGVAVSAVTIEHAPL